MSTSNDEYWKLVRALFQHAVALPDNERELYLDEHCDGNVELRQEVLTLLTADASANTIGGIVSDAAHSSLGRSAEEQLNSQLGNYRLIRVLGEGGMGTVYLAERIDQQYQQQVAIKVLNSYRPSRELISRFRTERQILANLDHPNIARLVDGGESDDGLPYLVMEYVEGEPITDYCVRLKLAVRDRLVIFRRVCEAVEHAHQNLVIHRDIKPSNILVTPEGDIKLLDFGIAKLMSPETLGATVAVTQDGSRLLTPGNASPEQVRGDSITTATDIYSLGILLYEMLTTRFPYDFDKKSAVDVQRMICTTDPERPSTRVEQAESALAEPPSKGLVRQLRGDLDNIVMVAIRKDATRRYASVLQFKEDIGHFLARRPVIARPDSLGYRAQRFVQRNAVAVGSAALFVVTVAALVGFYTAQLANERDVARLQAARAEQVSGFLTDLFREASPAKNFGKPMNALELLNTGAREISTELTTQPELRAALATTIGESYLTMRENKTARDFLQPLVPAIRQQLGERSPLFLRLQSEYGAAIMHAGDTPAGREILAGNLSGWEAVSPEGVPAGIAHRRLGTASRLLNQYDEAEIHYKEAIRIFRSSPQAPAALLTDTLMGYGVLHRRRNQFDAEEALLKEALEIQARCCGERQVDYASLVNNLGQNYNVRGWIDKAEHQNRRHAELQKALVGENGVAYANALLNLANSLVQKGDYDDALAMQRQVREIYGRGYGEDSIPYAYVTENIANGLMHLKRYDEARVEFLKAMAIIEEVFGVAHVEYAFTQSNYGNMLVRAGDLDEGLSNLEASHAVFLTGYGAENASTIGSHTKLATALMEKQDATGARVHALAAVEAAKRTWPDPHPATQDALESLARTYRMSKDYDAAKEVHAEAIAHANSIDGQPLNLIVKAEIALARTLIAEGNSEAARALLLQKRQQIADLGSDWDSTRESIEKLLASD